MGGSAKRKREHRLFGRLNAQEIEDLKNVWDKSELSECIRNVGGALKGYDNIIEVCNLADRK